MRIVFSSRHRRPKLLVITQTHNVFGGIEAWMADVFPYIENAGWTVEFGLALGARYNKPRNFLVHHPYIRRFHLLDGRVGTATARKRAIRSLLRGFQPDIVMPLAIGDTLPALREERCCGLKTRLLLAVHSTHTGTLADILGNLDLIDMVGVVSGLLSQWMSGHVTDAHERVRWIRNGVPRPVAATGYKRPTLLRVGYVGRLENGVKRVLDIPPIIEGANRLGVQLRFEVVGDGPAMEGMRNGLKNIHGWQDYSLYGHRSRSFVYETILSNLDCLLLTSKTEGSPLSVIEAMHHGVVPVVSQFHGYAAEGMLRPEENCLMFQVGDAKGAAEQLRRLADDTTLLDRLSDSARETAKLYTHDQMLQEWLLALNDFSLSSPRPCSSITNDAISQCGRLDRWRFPESVSNWLRKLRPNKFHHRSGFDEWPGSISSNSKLMNQIEKELMAIESVCLDDLHKHSGRHERITDGARNHV